MILYASSPDGVAAQQQFYDQYNLGANQNNAARFDAAQARALQATLTQRDYDQRAQQAADAAQQASNNAQQSAYQFNQGEDFSAGQNALDRASREKDVQTQYASTDKNRTDALNQKDFDNAQKLAMVGQVPQTEDKLKLQYPNFDENQIKVLANASSQYGFNKFQNALKQSITQGAPLPVEAIKNYVSPASTIYQDAVDHRSSVLSPYVTQYNSALIKAEAGNAATGLVKDYSENINSTDPGGSWLNPANWKANFLSSPITRPIINGINSLGAPGAAKIQPYIPESASPLPNVNGISERASAIVNALKSGQNTDVTIDPVTGKYVPSFQNPNSPQVNNLIIPAQPVSAPMVSGTGNQIFNSEAEARAAGHKTGDVVFFNSNGAVRKGLLQ